MRWLFILWAFVLVAQESPAPCDPETIESLRTEGFELSRDPNQQTDAIDIYRALNACEPNNPDTLFYLGRALARSGAWDEAKEVLKACLDVAPDYSDAAVQLGYIYLWEGNFAEAEAIFREFPENTDAKVGLGMAAHRQGRAAEAKGHYTAVIEQDPSHKEARRQRASLLASEMEYASAMQEYGWLVDDDPNESNYWSSLFDIGEHTRYALWLETLYTDAKEDDPDLKAPVVKDYYFMNAVHLLIPIFDQWRLDCKQIYYHQRENDIYPPVGVNYNAFLTGGQITSSYFFAKHWKWDVSLRAFKAWGDRTGVNYPFHSTTRFEPGTGFLYNSDRQTFSIETHVESFIIKDFSKSISELLRTDYLSAQYAYRVDAPLKPEFNALVTHVFIHDHHNWENFEIVGCRVNVPKAGDTLVFIYRFEHAHFDQLSQNYYSFKQQLRNVVGVRLHVPLGNSASWDTEGYHRWQTTYNLFQPIGNNVFVSPKQYLAGNWITTSVSARYKDRFRLMLAGHYFRDTLPYRDWNVTGSLLWQF
ncbi:MAG: hypothetical protein RL235_17 [Chlamydiota bacterium]|jgi:tetratricopeptide (TPR) repeat protein